MIVKEETVKLFPVLERMVFEAVQDARIDGFWQGVA